MAVDIFVTLQLTSAPLQQIAKAKTATFEAQSFSWGADNAPTIGSTSAGAGAGKAKFAEATLTKLADNVASPVLFQLLVTGEHLGTITIVVRKAGAAGPGPSTPEVLATITLATVSVTHFGQSVSGSDAGLQEGITLAYGAAQMTINGADATGKSVTGVPASWNQITNSQDFGVPLTGG
jgi:type VI protein secretion system component Hcp